MDATPAFPLRALGIGEIFDRAVTIYVRNFVTFTLMVLAVTAPFALVEYFAIPNSSSSITAAVDEIQHPGKHANDPAIPAASLVVLIVCAAAVMLLSPFVAGAVAIGVAAVYNGKSPDFAAGFASVFRRWLPILGTAIVELMIVLGTYSAAVFFAVIVFFVAVLSIKAALPLAILLFILGGIAIIAVVLLLIVLLVNYAFGTYAATLEGANVGEAVVSGFRRIFNRREIGKAVLIGLAYLALEIGVLTISGAVGALLIYLLKSQALQLAVSALLSSSLTAFLTIVLAVYYYDVRTRAEGLDLEVALQRLTA